MDYVVYSNKGKMRENNEDSYLIKDEPFPLFAVADGMGGHQAGEVASRLAVNFLDSLSFSFEEDPFILIDKAIKEINQLILKTGLDNADWTGMGTTLSMGLIYNQELYIGHIGDSRIYLFRDNKLRQLTRDHSLVNKLIEENQISFEEAFNHPQKHIITQALGAETELKVDLQRIILKSEDMILFCTDGLSDMIKFDDLQSVFQEKKKDINKLSNILGQKAMENGGNDNITLIICKMG
jgi:PPM family protein phosphatase